MKKLYEIKNQNVFLFLNEEDARKTDPEGVSLEEISEERTKAVLFLVSDEFLTFFTNPNSEYEVVSNVNGTDYYTYPDLMRTFRKAVGKAKENIGLFIENGKRKNGWTGIQEKYFEGRKSVSLDDVREKINDFSVDELIDLIFYYVVYEERFCNGVYISYAKEGIIGQILTRLKELAQ